MKVMFTVLYLTISFNGLSSSAWSCVEDPRTYSIEEMERIVYAVANEKGVPPTVILNRILRKVRFRQRNEKSRSRNTAQKIELNELLNSKFRPTSESADEKFSKSFPQRLPPLPPPRSIPPPLQLQPPLTIPIPRPGTPARPPLPPGQTSMMTGVLFSSGFQPQQMQNRPPYPQSFYVPVQNLRPPPGVTIRVKSGITDGTLPDVVVTLSPMMTIVEALKQAERKFRSLLDISALSEDDVISFRRSSQAECYVIGSFNGVESSDRGFWKIMVNDRNGEVIYDSVCLPSRNDVPVMPGTTITLLHTLI